MKTVDPTHPCPVALSKHKEDGKMLAQCHSALGTSLPSRTVRSASAKERNCTLTKEGRHIHFIACPTAFMVSFVVPYVFQKDPVPDKTTPSSLALVLELIVSYNFQFSQVYLKASNSRRKSKANQTY